MVSMVTSMWSVLTLTLEVAECCKVWVGEEGGGEEEELVEGVRSTVPLADVTRREGKEGEGKRERGRRERGRRERRWRGSGRRERGRRGKGGGKEGEERGREGERGEGREAVLYASNHTSNHLYKFKKCNSWDAYHLGPRLQGVAAAYVSAGILSI